MAKKSWRIKQKRPQKFKVREYQRCQICGRSRGVYRRFSLCRMCFRDLALKGQLSGVKKASW